MAFPKGRKKCYIAELTLEAEEMSSLRVDVLEDGESLVVNSPASGDLYDYASLPEGFLWFYDTPRWISTGISPKKPQLFVILKGDGRWSFAKMGVW